jgi:tRNA dimethylallyltransferase
MSILGEMSAAKFRERALGAISEIHSRGKLAIVVGGSGLYIKALTHGLSSAPAADPDLRAQLNELSLHDLQKKLMGLDPEVASKIDVKNRRRLVRAIEVCLLSEQKTSGQRREWESDVGTNGVFVFRERDEIYERINRRVEVMFEKGVIEEARNAGAMSETASKMIGLRESRDLLDDKMSILQCLAAIQQATRRYAKRQLTWFRRQTNFQPLNLSLLDHNDVVRRISQLAKSSGVGQGND